MYYSFMYIYHRLKETLSLGFK